MTESSKSLKFILLGASRGLGWATYLALKKKYPECQVLLVSRKIHLKEKELFENDQFFTFDFSKATALPLLTDTLEDFKPTHLIYFAAGGPFGFFEQKNWGSHEWALQVSFLTPAFLLHWALNHLKSFQFVFIGSAIAESKPDPQAASYCASKHALKGLIESVHAELHEKKQSHIKLVLFSPGYMKTDLLPAHSWPYEKGLVQSAEIVADELLSLL